MSLIKASSDHLVLSSDGSTKEVQFQIDGVEKASISSAGAFTSTTIDATALTGALPAISAASLTNVPAANITGTLPAIDGSNLTGLSSGLNEVDHWRITTDRATGSGSYAITANWERVDTYFEKIGTGMTESSGVFSFPSNGKWLVTHTLRANQVTGAARYVFFSIDVSVNSGGAYTGVAGGAICIPDAASSTDYSMGTVTHLLDVADKNATLVKFTGSTAAYIVIDGNTTSTETSALFQKVGDT